MPQRFFLAPAEAFALGPGTYPTEVFNYVNVAGTTLSGSVYAPSGMGRLVASPYDSATTLSQATSANTVQQIYRMNRFISAPFAQATQINRGAGGGATGGGAIGGLENNLIVNLTTVAYVLYLWRPSTGAVVATLSNVNGVLQAPEPVTALVMTTMFQATGAGSFFNNTSAAVEYVTAEIGDVLILDPLAMFTQGMATAYSISIAYGGPTAITASGVTNNTPAAYIEFDNGTSVQYPVLVLSNPSSFMTAAFESSASSKYIIPVTFLDAPLSSRASITAVMSDGFLSRITSVSVSTITANLTTQILLSSSLKSSSKSIGSFPQNHADITATLVSVASMAVQGDYSTPMAGLNLWYSGNGIAANSLGGTRSGVPMVDQVATLGVVVDGLVILTCSGFKDGNYPFSYSADSDTFTLVMPTKNFSAVKGTATRFIFGSNESGYLSIAIDLTTWSGASFSSILAISSFNGGLFPDPDAAEQLAGGTEYRCLYLVNSLKVDLTSVSVSFSGLGVETATLGTEYSSSFALGNPSIAASLIPTSVAPNALSRAGAFTLLAASQVGLTNSSGGGPFVFISASTGQSSDGVTTDLPLTIAGRTDPTNVLAGIAFGTTLSWPVIRAGKSVTFWVKKVRPPAPPKPLYQALRFIITSTI